MLLSLFITQLEISSRPGWTNQLLDSLRFMNERAFIVQKLVIQAW